MRSVRFGVLISLMLALIPRGGASQTYNPAFSGPRPGFGTPVVFGSIAAVNGFPRTLQLQLRVEW